MLHKLPGEMNAAGIRTTLNSKAMQEWETGDSRSFETLERIKGKESAKAAERAQEKKKCEVGL